MKKLVLAALAASTALIATPALSQALPATGTVTITGSVAPKCQVVPTGGGGVSQAFAQTVALGELADTDGTLKDTGTLETAFGSVTFRVVCTTAAPVVSVDADPIVAATATAPAGYANQVAYQADVVFTLVTPTPAQTVSNDSDLPATTNVALNNRLVGVGDNVTITASDFHTAAGTDIMSADPDYEGQIVVTISPI